VLRNNSFVSRGTGDHTVFGQAQAANRLTDRVTFGSKVVTAALANPPAAEV